MYDWLNKFYSTVALYGEVILPGMKLDWILDWDGLDWNDKFPHSSSETRATIPEFMYTDHLK